MCQDLGRRLQFRLQPLKDLLLEGQIKLHYGHPSSWFSLGHCWHDPEHALDAQLDSWIAFILRRSGIVGAQLHGYVRRVMGPIKLTSDICSLRRCPEGADMNAMLIADDKAYFDIEGRASLDYGWMRLSEFGDEIEVDRDCRRVLSSCDLKDHIGRVNRGWRNVHEGLRRLFKEFRIRRTDLIVSTDNVAWNDAGGQETSLTTTPNVHWPGLGL